MSKIQVSAKLKIIHGMLDEFKQQATKCISVVKDKDPGTLQYNWFLSSDRTECEIRKTYENSEAFLARISNLRDTSFVTPINSQGDP